MYYARKLRKIMLVAAVAACGVCAAASHVLFYPNVFNSGKNLLEGRKWDNDKREWGSYNERQEVLIDEPETVRSVSSGKPVSCYWFTPMEAQQGHTYIAGAWIRYENAKILFWNYGTNAETGNREERRLYCFGGFNEYLLPYFSQETLRILGGDPHKWQLCYRTMEFPKALKNDYLAVNIGLYMATGALDFIHPFLYDITDCKDRSLCIDIAESPKPIARLTVEHSGIRDVIWERKFDVPAREFKENIPDITDFNRNMDKNIILGYTLYVYYTDGTCQSVAAPKDNIFHER